MNKKDIVLIGDKTSKRFIFFDKAIDKNVYSFMCMDWNNIDIEILKNSHFVKIEPPTLETAEIGDLKKFINWYYDKLNMLQSLKGVRYLNSPKAIMECLDKVYSKQILENNNIISTEMIGYNVDNYDEFKKLLVLKNMREVFIKPRFGSGACGIIVYRCNPKNDKEIIYTTTSFNNEGVLSNYKKINKINDKKVIKELIDAICKNEVIVEKWEKKDTYKEYTYDLRVVYQFGKIEYIVARGSSGPITNLHLNNKPIEIEELNFTPQNFDEIKNICENAIKCFGGLNVIGIDILVTKDKKFKVIEINCQGDLIYNDIYNENIIYKNQIDFFDK